MGFGRLLALKISAVHFIRWRDGAERRADGGRAFVILLNCGRGRRRRVSNGVAVDLTPIATAVSGVSDVCSL